MLTPDYEILSTCRNWLRAGEKVWLCTIVRTRGSSPRPVGAMLACNNAGAQVGSLSGGCIEEDLLARIRNNELTTTAPQLIEYGISAAENERLGLPCGGRLYVLVEALSAQAESENMLDDIIHAISQRACIQRRLELSSGLTRLTAVKAYKPLTFDDSSLTQCFGPRMRMFLVGAGQLAQSLSELALAMDYEVLVTDPREAMLAQWHGPDVQLIGGMPDDVLREQANDSHSVIITLTHDPRIDDMALLEALTSDAWYIGALGSMRTTTARKARLVQLGLNDNQIARLHAPVGLAIGSKTPMEIAVAIMAEITQLRRKQ